MLGKLAYLQDIGEEIFGEFGLRVKKMAGKNYQMAVGFPHHIIALYSKDQNTKKCHSKLNCPLHVLVINIPQQFPRYADSYVINI